MPFIHLTSFIAAPRERVFDLSRSVDLHRASMKAHEEKIVDGVMAGLLRQGDTVTWTAKHLFRQRRLTTRITKMQAPEFFVDEQEKGDFKMMKHEHFFKPAENGTIMIDQFHFETPHGVLGRLFNQIVLVRYLTRLLHERNRMIKDAAEGTLWKQYINP